VTQLSTLATQFAEATARKYAGRQTQKGGTLGVDQSAQHGLAIVKELNAILTKKLRTTDPVLLGVWKAASHLEQPPRRTETADAPASGTTGSGSAGSGEAAAEPGLMLQATRPPAGGDQQQRLDATATLQGQTRPSEGPALRPTQAQQRHATFSSAGTMQLEAPESLGILSAVEPSGQSIGGRAPARRADRM
jgi:hypothetical protein